MRWLAVTGLALDVAGALAMAWPIIGAGWEEIREEGRPRLGGNPWIVIARTREQRLVRFGFLLLLVGFTCQLVAYVGSAFEGDDLVAALLVVVFVVGVAVTVVVGAARRGAPERWVPRPIATTIHDQRDAYEVADVAGVDRFWNAAWPAGFRHQGVAPARVNHGRWIADCSCGAGIAAWPENSRLACTECGAEYQAVFPNNAAEIENLLLRRPDPRTRNWYPGETVDDLARENAQNLGGNDSTES